MGGLRPDARPPRSQSSADRRVRLLTVAYRAALLGVPVALVITVAWTPQAGWVFLALVLASVILSSARGLARARASSRIAPLRVSRARSFLTVAVSVACGVVVVIAARHVTTTPLVVITAFLLTFAITGTVLRVAVIRSLLRPLPASLQSAQGLDFVFRSARSALEGSEPATRGWEHTLERCRQSVYEVAHDRARAGEAANARALTWRSAPCPGCSEPLASAWDEVIEAAHRGLRDGEEQRASVGPPGLLEQ
jgi:hypothetical protein